MADVFENVLGQPQVRDFLRASVSQNRVSHAYLFTGPAGSNKTLAALSFAQAILCATGGETYGEACCTTCDICDKVKRRKHPDVRIYTPEGANGYLVEQVRSITADATLAPIRANKKIYILDRVDLLGVQAANAFLKTLEEPPEDVVLILLARTAESVLPTIVSRCQVVPFRTIPDTEAAQLVVQNTGASLEQARFALAASNNSLEGAAAFLKSNERMAFRNRVFEMLGQLYHADDWDVIGYARELVALTQAPLDVVRAEQEQELAQNKVFLEKSALRQLEARHKRQLSAATMQSLHQLMALARSWLRDVLVICAQGDELIVNTDVAPALNTVALDTNEARAASALGVTSAIDRALTYNVSPETCIDVLLFAIRDILYGQSETQDYVRLLQH